MAELDFVSGFARQHTSCGTDHVYVGSRFNKSESVWRYVKSGGVMDIQGEFTEACSPAPGDCNGNVECLVITEDKLNDHACDSGSGGYFLCEIPVGI